MKKAVKQTKKTATPSTNKKNTRPFTAKQSGYKEEVYNGEEQNTYEKSDLSDTDKKNTSGPKS